MMIVPDRHHVRAQDEAESRRMRFQARHPEVHFLSPIRDPQGRYGAEWAAADGRQQQVRHAQLSRLLDELEELFGEPPC